MIKSAADDEDDPKMRKQSRWIDLVHTATEAV